MYIISNENLFLGLPFSKQCKCSVSWICTLNSICLLSMFHLMLVECFFLHHQPSSGITIKNRCHTPFCHYVSLVHTRKTSATSLFLCQHLAVGYSAWFHTEQTFWKDVHCWRNQTSIFCHFLFFQCGGK